MFAWCSQALDCLEKDLQLLRKCEVQLCDPCVDFLFCVASNSQNIEFGARKPPSSDEENVTVHSLRINEFMFISPGGNSEKNCFSFLLKRSRVRWLVHLIRMHPEPTGEIRYPL